jgi:hypothetical protein
VPWNRAVGEAWTSVLDAHELDARGTIVEVGPGFSDKIAFALAELRFRGTILLVEPNDAARRWAHARYASLLPHALVRTVASPVPDVRGIDGGRVDALLANHIFDDLVLHASVPHDVSARLFAAMVPQSPCSGDYVRTWQQVLREEERVEATIARVAHDLASYVHAVRPRLLAVNHYRSWRQRHPSLAPLHDVGVRTLHALQRHLGARSIPATNPAPMLWLTHGAL